MSLRSLVRLDVRVIFFHDLQDVIPKEHADLERVRLGDHGQFLAVARPGKLEPETQDALDALAGVDGRLHRDTVVPATCPQFPAVRLRSQSP